MENQRLPIRFFAKGEATVSKQFVGRYFGMGRMILALGVALLADASATQAASILDSGLKIENWTGTGVNTAALVVDFSPGNGMADSYAFGVRFGSLPTDTITGFQLIQAVSAGNANFDFQHQFYGPPPEGGDPLGEMIFSISYTDPRTQVTYDGPPVVNPTGMWLTYWSSGDQGKNYDVMWSSCSYRTIHDGDVDGYLAQATPSFDPSTWRQPVTPCYLDGDANGDGTVNIGDLGQLLSHYNETNSIWADGDFNGDGTVNITDLGMLLSHYNQTSSPASAVPEPASLALLGLAAVAFYGVAFCRRRWVAA
jgi:hypothetical protein